MMAGEPMVTGENLSTTSHRGGLWSLTDGHRREVGLLALFTFMGALVEAGFLVLLTAALVAVAGTTQTIGPILGVEMPLATALGVASIAIGVRLALHLVAVRLSATLTSEVTKARRQRLGAAYLRTSWAVQQREPSGRLQELLTSFVSRVTTAVLAMTQAITATLSLIAFVGTGAVVQPLATGAMLLSLLLLGLALAPIRRAIRRRAGSWSHMNLAFANKVAELSALGQEMQTFGVREKFVDQVNALTKENAKEQRAVQGLNGVLSPLYTSLAYAAILGGILVLMRLPMAGIATIGAVMLLLLRSLSYGQQLLTVSGQLATSVPFLKHLEEALRAYELDEAPTGTIQPTRAAPIEFDNVTFSYDNVRVPALTQVAFCVREGETIGVIGPSGSGKSTLAQLMLGLRRPTEGAIRVAGFDLDSLDRSWWTARTAFVAQEPRLITGTVAENIRFFRAGLSEEDLERAAIQANLLADIEALPRGFDTHLGERGSEFSGGQRQRLSIARALIGEPELLILDEPTSALDGHSELMVRDSLEGLRGSVSMVIIAHRMSTLDLCDRIVVVEDGRITADATPLELREQSDFYRRALHTAGIT